MPNAPDLVGISPAGVLQQVQQMPETPDSLWVLFTQSMTFQRKIYYNVLLSVTTNIG